VLPRFDAERTALMVIDVQEKLLPHMHNAGVLVSQVGRLLDAAGALGLPTLVTEQYPKGLGKTVGGVAGRLPEGASTHEKVKFSACIEPVRKILAQKGIRCVLVCGIEAHVCVLQTCLDLADRGLTVGVVVDAIGSRRLGDQEVAVWRLIQAGIVPTTTEAAVLEMVHEAGGSRFKAVLPLIK